ncbi:MAG TPA: C45 family autoproteolytic acyltransferase/hydrolase [Kofleriaceae bacterium]|nr:C45 family autoproteolytic acyltransferase/hydrolase [Kofleriaceae bacterium]
MSDLVIGTRRPSTTRNMRGLAIIALVLLIALIVAYVIFRRLVSYVEPEGSVPPDPLVVTASAGSDRPTSLGFGRSSLSYAGRIGVLRLVGKPHTLGASQGRLLGDAVNRVTASLVPAIDNTVSSGGWFGGSGHATRVRWRHRMLDDGIPGHQLLEIAGVVRGTHRSANSSPGYASFLRAQAALDVGAPPRSSDGHDFRAMTRSLSFVATLRGTSGDRLLIGRSLALPGAADGGDSAARELTVSFVRDSDDATIPYASVGWPGLVGVLSGINAEGIAVMVHPANAGDVRVTREAQPVPLLAREILEQARTLDDAVGILEQANPLGAAAFLIVDGNARTWAVVDRSPQTVSVARGKTPPVITDILTSSDFENDPENDRARRIRPSEMRARRAAQLLKVGASDPSAVVSILRDSRGPAGTPLPIGHRGAPQDLSAVHTAIFDASGMVLWVSEGPGASGRFRAFDLRYELRGEGARPAPPADLPADPEFDVGGAEAILSARADLRAARRAWNDDDRRQARELVQRALARAPHLPEALRLAGDYARRGGDHAAATAFYERYLAGGADDLAAEEEINALLKNR